MFEKEVEIVQNVLGDTNCQCATCQSWNRIKTALAELGTTPNPGSPKCLCDTCQNEGCRGVEIPYSGKWTMHECKGYKGVLRDGA